MKRTNLEIESTSDSHSIMKRFTHCLPRARLIDAAELETVAQEKVPSIIASPPCVLYDRGARVFHSLKWRESATQRAF
jgi:hypothetical protein